MKILAIIFLLLQVTDSVFGSKILFLFPTPSKSHMVIIHAVSTALAEKGHDVTVVSTFPLGKSIKNHREIHIQQSDAARQKMNHIIDQGPKSFLKMISSMLDVNFLQAQAIFDSKEFEKISNENFDLLVIGMNFQNFLLGFGEKFNCPTMILSIQRHNSITNLVSGNPISVNTAAHYNIAKHDMNFIDRVKNFLLHGMDHLFFYYSCLRQKALYEKYFPNNKRTYDEAVRNISLFLINDHFSDGIVRPNIPSVIDIRGIQVKTEPSQLPENIQQFLDEAKDGVIFFSLGSNVKTETISEEAIEIILSVFAKLPQRVIMKWDSDMKGISKNIMLSKWLPQNDILAHPNVKVFISHCGLGGIVESKYHGVPILALPLFADQFMNAKVIVKEGWAIQMNLKDLAANDFESAIKKLINDEKYSATVRGFSKVLRDKPMSPKDTAVYWTEYVINHRGAKHLHYSGVHQNFFQRASLDVIGFILLCIYIAFKIVKIILKLLLRLAKKIVGKKEAIDKSKKWQ